MPCGPPVIVFRQSGIGTDHGLPPRQSSDCGRQRAWFGSVYNFDAIADHFTFDLGPELPRRLDRTSR